MLIGVHTAPALAGLANPVLGALADPTTRPGLIEGLRKSEKRAVAVKQLQSRLQETTLFSVAWLSHFVARLGEGQKSTQLLALLTENVATLETVLRVQAILGQLPPPLQAAARALLDQCVPAEEGVTAIRKGILAGDINDRLQTQPKLRTLDPHASREL